MKDSKWKKKFHDSLMRKGMFLEGLREKEMMI